MSARYEIRPESGLLLTTFSGVVTGREFIALYRSIFDDPAWRAGIDEFADLRDVTRLDVDRRALDEVHTLTRRAYRDADVGFRTAVIAPSDLSFGVARIYEAVAEDGPENVSVFRSADEGRAWLGVWAEDSSGDG